MSVNWDEYSDLRAPILVTDDKGLEVIVKKVQNSRWNGMCIHPNGVFSLIDFGISIIGDETTSDQIYKRNCVYDDYDQYIKMFKQTTYAILRQFNS
jgi:hypothetical protein